MEDRGGKHGVRVPIDDVTTAHWWYRCYPMVEGDKPQAAKDIPYYTVPCPDLDGDGSSETCGVQGDTRVGRLQLQIGVTQPPRQIRFQKGRLPQPARRPRGKNSLPVRLQHQHRR